MIPVYVNEIGGDNTINGLMLTGLVTAGIITRIFRGEMVIYYNNCNRNDVD